MRCSSCELLLDAYLERELPPRDARRVTGHLKHCASCRATLQELRVVDGLLATVTPVTLPPNFRFVAMTQLRELPVPRRTRGAVWIGLAFYVICAWIAASVAVFFARNGLPPLGPGTLESVIGALTRGGPWHALIGTLRAFSPLTPLVAPAFAVVLAVDIVLAFGVLFFYRGVRPWLAARLSETEA